MPIQYKHDGNWVMMRPWKKFPESGQLAAYAIGDIPIYTKLGTYSGKIIHSTDLLRKRINEYNRHGLVPGDKNVAERKKIKDRMIMYSFDYPFSDASQKREAIELNNPNPALKAKLDKLADHYIIDPTDEHGFIQNYMYMYAVNEPSEDKHYNAAFIENHDKNTIELWSLTDIHSGEEITACYGGLYKRDYKTWCNNNRITNGYIEDSILNLEHSFLLVTIKLNKSKKGVLMKTETLNLYLNRPKILKRELKRLYYSLPTTRSGGKQLLSKGMSFGDILAHMMKEILWYIKHAKPRQAANYFTTVKTDDCKRIAYILGIVYKTKNRFIKSIQNLVKYNFKDYYIRDKPTQTKKSNVINMARKTTTKTTSKKKTKSTTKSTICVKDYLDLFQF